MLNYTFVSPLRAGECHLITGERSAVLIDTGLPYCAAETIDNIKKALGDKKIESIFLSHSHYDHIGGLTHIRRAFPDAKVYAHPYTIQVFSRPGAIKKMEELCLGSAELFGKGFSGLPPLLSEMGEILPLNDGDTFPFDDSKLVIVYTPGHTKDAVSIDFPDEEILFPSETLGVKLQNGHIQPCFLTGMQDTIDSIERIRALGNRRFVFNHTAEIFGKEENDTYLDTALDDLKFTSDLICRLYDEGKDFDTMFDEYCKVYWSESYRPFWPFEAFRLNTTATINIILKELRGQ